MDTGNRRVSRRYDSSSFTDSKKHLIEEVDALLPPGKSFQDTKKLTTEDLNLLVHHAHKKVSSG